MGKIMIALHGGFEPNAFGVIECVSQRIFNAGDLNDRTTLQTMLEDVFYKPSKTPPVAALPDDMAIAFDNHDGRVHCTFTHDGKATGCELYGLRTPVKGEVVNRARAHALLDAYLQHASVEGRPFLIGDFASGWRKRPT